MIFNLKKKINRKTKEKSDKNFELSILKGKI